MRLFMVTVFLVVCSCLANSQHNQSSLDRYSYLIQTSKQDQSPQAIGFFVRYDTRLFLVTSTCFLKADNASAIYPDTIFIQPAADTSRSAQLSLPVIRLRKPVKSTAESDICIVEIKNAKRYNVFSVEDFFVEEVPCELAKSVLVAGYTTHSENDEQGNKGQTFVFNSSLEEAYCLLTYIPGQKDYDAQHYFPSFARETAKPALSGAPAYLLTKDDTIVFGGVYVGMSQGTERGKIIRPEHVINQVINRINQK